MADLTDCLGRLAAQSLTYCEDPALPDGLELANWQALSGYIHQESHSVKAFKTSAAAGGGEERDVYEEWRFSPMYRDRGLPLERSTLLPQLASCLSCQLPLVAADARTARPPLPFLPRSASCLVEVLDLDVTCPDLETAVIFPSLIPLFIVFFTEVFFSTHRPFYLFIRMYCRSFRSIVNPLVRAENPPTHMLTINTMCEYCKDRNPGMHQLGSSVLLRTVACSERIKSISSHVSAFPSLQQ
jgi:hypothetical protein